MLDFLTTIPWKVSIIIIFYLDGKRVIYSWVYILHGIPCCGEGRGGGDIWEWGEMKKLNSPENIIFWGETKNMWEQG